MMVIIIDKCFEKSKYIEKKVVRHDIDDLSYSSSSDESDESDEE